MTNTPQRGLTVRRETGRARGEVIGAQAVREPPATSTEVHSLAPPPHNRDRPRDSEGVPSPGAGTSTTDDRYRKVETTAEILPCKFCGARAELWQRREFDDVWSNAVMCTSCDDEEPCAFRLPPEDFHHATKREALAYWNRRHLNRRAVLWIYRPHRRAQMERTTSLREGGRHAS